MGSDEVGRSIQGLPAWVWFLAPTPAGFALLYGYVAEPDGVGLVLAANLFLMWVAFVAVLLVIVRRV